MGKRLAAFPWLVLQAHLFTGLAGEEKVLKGLTYLPELEGRNPFAIAIRVSFRAAIIYVITL